MADSHSRSALDLQAPIGTPAAVVPQSDLSDLAAEMKLIVRPEDLGSKEWDWICSVSRRTTSIKLSVIEAEHSRWLLELIARAYKWRTTGSDELDFDYFIPLHMWPEDESSVGILPLLNLVDANSNFRHAMEVMAADSTDDDEVKSVLLMVSRLDGASVVQAFWKWLAETYTNLRFSLIFYLDKDRRGGFSRVYSIDELITSQDIDSLAEDVQIVLRRWERLAASPTDLCQPPAVPGRDERNTFGSLLNRRLLPAKRSSWMPTLCWEDMVEKQSSYKYVKMAAV